MIKWLCLLASVFATPALAQSAPKKASDPNRVICRTEEVIGSRLETKRHCMTAQQWIQYRREAREAIENVQRFEAKGS